MTLDEALKHSILRCEVGSTAFGVSLPSSDKDEMAICVEPLVEAMGVGAPFENAVSSTNDFTCYSLRKWVRLALKGNPTILSMLWAPVTQWDTRGVSLREFAPSIVARSSGKAFLGYLQAQRQRLLGERGQKRIKRPELEEAFGFDTKYAMHMLRLGMQGVELLKTGAISFPFPEAPREFLLGVREGKHDLQSCLTVCGELEQEIKELIDGDSPLQENPDPKPIEEWMLRIYLRYWSATQKVADKVLDEVIKNANINGVRP